MEKSIVITINNLVKHFPVGGDLFTALKDINLMLKEMKLKSIYHL